MTTCNITGCDSTILARGWCHKHYQRWYRYGDPTIVLRVTRSPEGDRRPTKNYNCQICGATFQGKQSRDKDGRNKFCSRRCHAEHRRNTESFAGPNNPNWKGGVTQLHKKRPHPYTQQDIRIPIYERDGYACRECGMTNNESRARFGRDLSIHHIKRYVIDPDDSPENLLTVCSICHPKLHWVAEHGTLALV
jgi:hypothetical protein